MLVHQNMEWKVIEKYEVFAESGKQLLVIIMYYNSYAFIDRFNLTLIHRAIACAPQFPLQ